MKQQPSLGFIGAGKVGHTLARLWGGAGYSVQAIYNRTEADARALAALVKAKVVASPDAVVQAADLTLLTVSDDAIGEVVSKLHELIPPLHAMGRGLGGEDEKAIIHTSGARDASILSPLAEQRWIIGSLHPVYPFADVETAIVGLPGATFAVEAEDERLRGWLNQMVMALRGRVLAIPAGGKAAYHSALVFASNYVVTLYAVAERLLLDLGAERAAAKAALNGLLAGTVENLQLQGIPAALTGPLVRGDAQTISAHLQALGKIDPDLAELYRQLARFSLPMLAARDIETDLIEQLLNKD